MKPGKAAGTDQLRSEDLLHLPAVLHCRLWMRCESTQTWPDALRLQQMVFLPKPAHAGKVPQADQLRPIVLLPHILKAWSVHRQHHIRNPVLHYVVHVQRELAKLLLQLRSAVTTNQVVSGAHLDLAKAFEL
eukprot:5227825-Amphidinium_carterae.1